jgi:biopolymer transport protein ExbB/TolQ
MSVLFYGSIHKGWIQQPLVVRYFAGHPIEYITTIMFFIGIAILLVKYFTILSQRRQLQRSPILPPNPQPLPVHQTNNDLDFVQAHEKKYGVSPLTERLKIHLQSLRRSGTTSNLNAEIRSRAEDAAGKADADYGLVRLILWAIPMLGFLGTVIGITTALDNLDLTTIAESSKKLSEGLAVAFDTTGLAIALDVALFFVQFLVYREESNLLSATDQLTEMELCGRFEQGNDQEKNDPIIAIRRMLETISTSIEQANKTTIQFNEAFGKSAAPLLALREETARQTEAIREILGTKSQLIQLEASLQKNLSTLASVGNFEETVNSLAAAIHLLNSNRRHELRAG